MKLVVGLGNPGKEYENTRHNCGFMAIDNFLAGKDLKGKTKFNGLYYEISNKGEKIIILMPQSYMNDSGKVVEKFVRYFNIDIQDVLVIYDDMDISVGSYKIKKTGSCAGHNGINDIINQLHTQNINRIKIGISRNNNSNAIDYVLGKFSKEDNLKLNKLFENINNIINDFINYGMDVALSNNSLRVKSE